MMRRLIFVGFLFCFGFLLGMSVFLVHRDAALAQVTDPFLSSLGRACQERVMDIIQEEHDLYRRIQYGNPTPVHHGDAQASLSVLGVGGARTIDLVPYLVLNYHAFSCRLRVLCQAVRLSHGRFGIVPPQRPIGCARLFAARGRWWSPERRGQVTIEPIEECTYVREGESPIPSDTTVAEGCELFIDRVLAVERQFLPLLVAQDSAHRGTRRVVGVLQAVLTDVRDSFLEPLRGVVDLFGSVIHPIPCLLTQCN